MTNYLENSRIEFAGLSLLASDQIDDHLPGLQVISLRNSVKIPKINEEVDLREISGKY